MKQVQLRWAAGLIALSSLAALGMHAYLGGYSRFIADDYCSAAEALRLGILRGAWYWYRTWNGRYSANVLDALFGRLGPGVTPAVTGIVLALWLAVLTGTMFVAIGQLNTEEESPVICMAIAGAELFLTLALTPNVAQALYWGQGMRSIVPPLIAMTAYAGIFLWVRQRVWSTAARWTWTGLSFVLAYGAGGFSETYTALQLAALALTLAVWFALDRRTLKRDDVLFLAGGLIGAALSFLTVMISPGNSARAAFYPAPPAVPALLGIAVNSYGKFLWDSVSSAARLLSLVAAVSIGLWAGAALQVRVHRGTTIWIVLLLGAILTFCCFLPAAYGLSDAPPERTLLIPTYLLILTMIALGASTAGWLASRWRALAPASNVAVLLVMAAAAISIIQIARLQPEYAAYAGAWGVFHAQMLEYRHDGTTTAQITTEALNANNWTGLNVLGDNPKFWLNQCVSEYYGVRVISTSP